MKLKLLAITAVILTTSVTLPLQAQAQCPENSKESTCFDASKDRRDRRQRNYDVAINQIYREVLGRNVDPDGLRTYREKLEDGYSFYDIREDVADSREARDVVNRLYEELLGRDANRNTVREYTRRLAEGWTLRDVRADILESNEYRGRDRRRRRRRPFPFGL